MSPILLPYLLAQDECLFTLCRIIIWTTRGNCLFNPRRACAARVTVVGSVCVCVCVSVQHLTSRASVYPEINVTYSTGNEVETIVCFFSETAPLQTSCIVRRVWLWAVGHCYSVENACVLFNHASYDRAFFLVRCLLLAS